MCIRDRLQPHRGHADAPAGRVLAAAGRAAPGIGDLQRPVAVSYTHLRAHETVLDLVCRLLLETKKAG